MVLKPRFVIGIFEEAFKGLIRPLRVFSILAYNTYAVSCVEYLCQLFWVPARLLKLEARAVAIILRIPSFAFGVDGPLQLSEHGILSCRSILAVNFAAMFRASRITLQGWQDSWGLLQASTDSRQIESCNAASLSHACSDSLPIVARLFTAYNGFRDDHLACMPAHAAKQNKASSMRFRF